jgi:hypothetical protein
MIKHPINSVICCLILTIIFKTVSAQSDADSISYKQAVFNLINHFDQGIGEESRLYNGFGYNYYDPNIKGNAYLDDVNRWRNGTVDYDGQTFENVPLIYDINADQVIVSLYNHNSPSRLVSDKVASFNLSGRHFVRVPNNSSNIKSGFYEQLYGGKSQVLNKYEKAIHTTNSSSGLERYFIPVYDYQEYYIRKDDKYYSIGDGSLSAVLEVFKDKKKELRQFIKDKKIQFNSLHELALVNIATYYDHLTN